MNLAERVIRRVDYYVADRGRTPESSRDLASNLAEDRRLLPVVVGEGQPHPLLDSDGDVHALDFAVAAEIGRMIGLSDRVRIHGRTEQRMVARVMEQLLPAGRIAHTLGDDLLEIGILSAKTSLGFGEEGFVRVSDVNAARSLAHELATEDDFRGAAAAFLYGFVALAGSPVGDEPIDSPEELQPEVSPVEFVTTLAGDSVRLSVVSGAVEVVAADLRSLADRPGVDRDVAVNADRLATVLSSLSAMSPPLVRALNGSMLDAVALLLANDDLGAGPEAAATERLANLVADQPDSLDGASWREPLQALADFAPEDLDPAAEAIETGAVVVPFGKRVRLAASDGAVGGVGSGVEGLVKRLIIGSPAAALEALGWLTSHRSWLAAALRFAFGILQRVHG